MNRKDADTARRLQADPAGRAIIAEATRKAVPMHTGGWVTANNVLAALDREGYTVAPRASQAATDEPELTAADRAVLAAQNGERCIHVDPDWGHQCTLAAGHDTHIANGCGWTLLPGEDDVLPARASQAATAANGPGCDAGAAHDGDRGSSALSALRDRIAEALALHLNGPASDGRGWYRTEADRIDCYARADAVMAVVQPELDAKDAEIAQRKSDVDMLSDRVTELEGDSDYWRKRAEAAEAQLRDQNGHHT